MSKVAVVYWSGTGNTEAMAEAVAKGAREAGASVDVASVSDFDSSRIASYDGVALGCPAMGAESLEDGEFEPFWESVKGELAGKKLALFGSYGWGDGEWMRKWEEDAGDIVGSYICLDAPGADEEAECKALGEKLA